MNREGGALTWCSVTSQTHRKLPAKIFFGPDIRCVEGVAHADPQEGVTVPKIHTPCACSWLVGSRRLHGLISVLFL